ncbi:diacylglycerol/lipid kinase family protein [Pseudidiomarina sp. E22-M8]|uniref:diacylglycerol/lipid kinase family protein n=1 Tax=Pseudidiomarina sp. E22-M8 TaxID=3424768 RepID=UPI00403C846C
MPTKAIAIYYKSSSARARSYAEVYQRQLNHDYGASQIQLLASQADRKVDIQQLHEWQDNHAHYDELECIVIGGDGSVNIVAQVATNSKLELSVVPSGTGNDLASALTITDWRWRLQSEGELIKRSVGKLGEYYFINHAGCGISVALQQLQGPLSKRWLGRYSYLWALCRYVFWLPKRRCKIAVTHDDGSVGYDEFQVATVNRTIGGGIVVYPDAKLTQPQLGLLRVPQRPRWRQFNALYWLLRKQPQRSPMISFSEATKVTLGDSVNQLELDGDSVDLCGPVDVEICVGGLTVRRPISTR